MAKLVVVVRATSSELGAKGKERNRKVVCVEKRGFGWKVCVAVGLRKKCFTASYMIINILLRRLT